MKHDEILIKSIYEYDNLPANFETSTGIIIDTPSSSIYTLKRIPGNAYIKIINNSNICFSLNRNRPSHHENIFSIEVFNNSIVEVFNPPGGWGGVGVWATDNSKITVRNNNSTHLRGNCCATVYGGSITVSENSHLTAYENAHISTYDDCTVKCFESILTAIECNKVIAVNCKIDAIGKNMTIKAFGKTYIGISGLAFNNNILLYDTSSADSHSADNNIYLHGHSYLRNYCINAKAFRISPFSVVSFVESRLGLKLWRWLEEFGCEIIDENFVILYKRVSHDFKTQEHTCNETLWTIGTTLNHKAWNPIDYECGSGKFHACPEPIYCDAFRSLSNDRYIAIKINIDDLYLWNSTEPSYPDKIAFKAGEVLYECDVFGDEVK